MTLSYQSENKILQAQTIKILIQQQPKLPYLIQISNTSIKIAYLKKEV